MKSKINSPDENCFNLPTGYSIDMTTVATISFGAESFFNLGSNIWSSTIYWFNNF